MFCTVYYQCVWGNKVVLVVELVHGWFYYCGINAFCFGYLPLLLLSYGQSNFESLGWQELVSCVMDTSDVSPYILINRG